MTAPLWLRRPALGLLLSVATAAAAGCGDDLGARPPETNDPPPTDPADPTTMTGALCASGQICTIAGTGAVGAGGDGGPAREATLHRPFGIAFDAAGDLYVADTLNSVVRRVVRP